MRVYNDYNCIISHSLSCMNIKEMIDRLYDCLMLIIQLTFSEQRIVTLIGVFGTWSLRQSMCCLLLQLWPCLRAVLSHCLQPIHNGRFNDVEGGWSLSLSFSPNLDYLGTVRWPHFLSHQIHLVGLCTTDITARAAFQNRVEMLIGSQTEFEITLNKDNLFIR